MTILSSLGLQPRASVNDNRALKRAERLFQTVERKGYDEAEQLLKNTSDEYRERLIYGFASHDDCVPTAAAWVNARRNSSVAHTVLGASLIVTGWNIRGGSYAEDVDAKAWEPFLRSLESAEDPLYTAAELDKYSADPYGWLIHAELGGNASRKKLEELFSAAISRDSLHWPSHYKYFSALTEKWAGSHKEMFAFARETSKRAPIGSILHSLIPQAYSEYVLAMETDAYKTIKNKNCATEVINALYAWLGTGPDSLSETLMEKTSGFTDHALNHFAVACYLSGAHTEAKELVVALRGEIESIPWGWIAKGFRERSNPAFVYDRVERELGLVKN